MTIRRTDWLASALCLATAAVCAAAEPPAAVKLFDGRTLEGWQVLDKLAFEKPGRVEVKDGELILGAGQFGTGIVWKGKPPRDNYELSLQARRKAGDDFFCGLTFPVGKEYCTLILGGWGGSVTGLSNIDDASAVENDTTGYVPFKNNQWYAIRLRVTKAKIEAWVDREQIVEVTRRDKRFAVWWEQEPARPLGITTWTTTAGLKAIELRALKEQQ